MRSTFSQHYILSDCNISTHLFGSLVQLCIRISFLDRANSSCPTLIKGVQSDHPYSYLSLINFLKIIFRRGKQKLKGKKHIISMMLIATNEYNLQIPVWLLNLHTFDLCSTVWQFLAWQSRSFWRQTMGFKTLEICYVIITLPSNLSTVVENTMCYYL